MLAVKYLSVIVCVLQLPNKSINSLIKHYYTQWKRSYLQVSLLDLRAQERQKKEPNQPRYCTVLIYCIRE